MIAAITLMCALHSSACKTDDARAIASAIEQATDDDGLRAHLAVYAWHESGFRIHPRPVAWDALAGKAQGPWQLWTGNTASVGDQARHWLWLVQRGGLAALDSSPRRARHRAQEAQRLLDRARD